MRGNGKRAVAFALSILFCCTWMGIDPAFAAVNEIEALTEEAAELAFSAESEAEESKAEESETKDQKNEADETSVDAAEESTEETEAVWVDSSAHGAAGDHTADEAIAWLSSVNGQGLDMDGAYGPQCVDLIVAYQDFLGVGTRVWGNAKDYAYKDIPGCTRIAGATPQKGDILIFTGGGGGYGHVAIFESEYRSWDQNGSQGQVVGVHNLHWTNMGEGYYGVIRPNFRTVPQNRQPRGAVDLIETGTGTLRVAGWAVDDDSPGAAISVHIYVGDCAREGSTAEQYAITANKYRSDVGNHSFDETLDVSKVGNQRICVYLIDANVNDNPCKFDGYRTIGEGVPLSSGSRAVPDGYYQIVSAIDDQYELDVDGVSSFSTAPNVQLWKNRDEKKDVFYLSYDNGFYEIKHTLSGKCLEVDGGSRANKANVQAHSDNDSVAQRWAVKPNGRYWNIEAKCSGYRLDAFGGKVFSDKTTNVCVHRANDSDAQKWRLIPFAPNEKRTLEDGNYHIVSRMDGETKGLHVSGTSGDFRNVTAAENLLDPNQVFRVTYESSTGAYIMRHQGTSLFLEIESSGTKQNIGVATGDTNGRVDGDWKRWVLKKDASGYYGIVSLKTGEGIYYNPRNNGNVTCDTCNLTYADQHFRFLRAVDGISLNASGISMSKGESRTLTAAVIPANAANQSVSWLSSDKKVAVVENGIVKAVGAGTARITVKTADGGKTAVCDVSVITDGSENPGTVPTPSPTPSSSEDQEIEGFRLLLVGGKNTEEVSEASLAIGKTLTLSATAVSTGVKPLQVNWISSDASVASVTQSGKITAKTSGTAVIEAVSEGGEYKASCAITVYEPVTSIKLGVSSLKLGEGDSATIPVTTILPETASDSSLVWSSGDEGLVSVDQRGRVTAGKLPSGKKSASAVITAKAADGSGKTARCTVTVGKAISTLSIAPKTGTSQIAKGKTLTLLAKFEPMNPVNQTVIWTSSNESVATVSKGGVVKGQKAGRTTIFAVSEAGEKSASYTVQVYVPATGLKLSQSSITLGQGKSCTLQTTVAPLDATGTAVSWSSSNESLVTVDENGKITAKDLAGKRTGTAKVTATLTSDGGVRKSASCTVTVKPAVVVTGVKLSKSSLKLGEGSKYQLSASTVPFTADNTDLIWNSSDEDLVRVDEDGTLIAGTLPSGKKTAIAKITATSADGSRKSASCMVTVGNAVTSLTIANGDMRLAQKKTASLKLIFNNGTKLSPVNTNVTWESSNEDIVRVSSRGVVTAVGAGTAVITVTAEEEPESGERKSASCTVTSYIPVARVTLNRSSLTIGVGKFTTLSPSVITPANASNQSLIWSSSNPDIAAVDEDGNVTAKGVGTARITATTADGSKKNATCSIRVLGRVNAISIAETRGGITKQAGGDYTLRLKKGKIATAKAVVTPSNAVDKSVSYRSSNRAVATVSASGQIKALSPGTTVITVTASDGGYQAKCTVTVE